MSFEDHQVIKQAVKYDEYGVPFAVSDGYEVPTNTPSVIFTGADEYGYGTNVSMVEDSNVPDLYRVAVTGKVSIQIVATPVGGTNIQVVADTPLGIKKQTSPHDTVYVIPNEKKLYVTQIVVGCQGDPSVDGSKCELIFNDGSDHLLERVYVMGLTTFNYPNVCTTRDGTEMIGNGTNTFIVRRIRLSVAEQEIDAVARGYII